jgi:hypothetical protein
MLQFFISEPGVILTSRLKHYRAYAFGMFPNQPLVSLPYEISEQVLITS